MARERSGRWFDPDLVDALDDFEARHTVLGPAGRRQARSTTCSHTSRPISRLPADDAHLDRIADAFALIIDAKSPFTFDHSRRVASYAVAINERLGDGAVDAVRLRRAALLHDLGKLTVPNRILDKPGQARRRRVGDRQAASRATR